MGLDYNQYILVIATIMVYFYLVNRGVKYFIEKDCKYPDGDVCSEYTYDYETGSHKSNMHYDEARCELERKEYDDCRAQNELMRLYTILPIALASMIGGLFIPNKPIAIAISLAGLLLLLNVVWDNWYKMDEKTKLALMGATFVILIFAIINIEKGMKYFRLE